jgi:chaperonin GroEL (HSP60 family)
MIALEIGKEEGEKVERGVDRRNLLPWLRWIFMSEANKASPVRIVKDQTRTTSGTEVQEKMIAAARVFSDILRPTYGPRGLDKMLYKTDGNRAVTNDGARIVSELLVKHPAAKMMVSMGETQEEISGDGVTGTLLVCGSLLEEASRLMSRGLHPLTIVEGYRKSLEISIRTVDARSRPVNEDDLERVAHTAMTGKSANPDFFAPLLVESLEVLKQSGHAISTESFGMTKTGVGTQIESRLIRGIQLKKRVPSADAPNNLENANVLVIRGDIKIRKMTRTAEVRISDSDELDSFIQAEMERKMKISSTIERSSADLVLCGGEIDRDILHELSRSGTLVIQELDSSEIEQVALCTNSIVVDSVMDIDDSMLGKAGAVRWVRRPSTDQTEDTIEIDDCPSPRLVSFAISGTSDTSTEETIRCIHDAIRSILVCEQDPRVVTGAGSIYARIANDIRNASLLESGRERLAMEAYARALETIPFVLATNAGREGLDAVLEIRTKSRDEVKEEFGVSEDGTISIIEEVLHPALSTISSLEAAVETTVAMLRIDQVVSARGD